MQGGCKNPKCENSGTVRRGYCDKCYTRVRRGRPLEVVASTHPPSVYNRERNHEIRAGSWTVQKAGMRQKHKPCDQCGGSLKGLWATRKYCDDCAPSGPDQKKWHARIYNYGVDKQMFDAMYFEQNGQCLLCDNEATDIDHCHENGKVRGLLCNRCNTRLGHLEYDEKWLTRAFAYLEEGSS